MTTPLKIINPYRIIIISNTIYLNSKTLRGSGVFIDEISNVFISIRDVEEERKWNQDIICKAV